MPVSLVRLWRFVADVAVVGAPGDGERGLHAGAVHVFERVDGQWTELQKIFAPDASSLGSFGVSLALSPSGETLVVGATGVESWTGLAYVFERTSPGNFEHRARLSAFDRWPRDLFGVSVAINDGRIAVGAMRQPESGFDGGAVYLFQQQAGDWVLEDKIVADDGQAGDSFGQSVALRGQVLVAGAPYDDDLGIEDSGAVYVVSRVQGEWSHQHKLRDPHPVPHDRFGMQLALSQTGRLVVRAGGGPDGDGSSAFLFDRCSDGRWFAHPLATSGSPIVDLTRQSVAILGNRLILGTGGDWHRQEDAVQFFDLSRRENSSPSGIVATGGRG